MRYEQIGKYKVKQQIGRGGMATVYLGEDPTFGRQVAIKVLPEQFVKDDEFQKRFNQEAQVIAALEHAAIVPVYDFGQVGEQPYLVMRYMPGGSLASRIKEKGYIEPEEAARILDRLGAALDYAHSQKVIHRDLKPENILFGQGNDVFLSDFGIAKLMESTTNLTGEGALGTPRYMSPEQAFGKKLDHRTDLYSLGVILYEMLTGRPLFEADTPIGLAMAHIMENPPNILEVEPDVPPSVKPILDAALAKSPDDRFQTGKALSKAFTEAIRPQASDGLELKDAVIATEKQPSFNDPSTTKISAYEDDDTKTFNDTEKQDKKTDDDLPTQVSPISDNQSAGTVQSRGVTTSATEPKSVAGKMLGIVAQSVVIALATIIVAGLVLYQLQTGIISVLPGGPQNEANFRYDVGEVETLTVQINVGATTVTVSAGESNSNTIEGVNSIESELKDLNVDYFSNDIGGQLSISQDVEDFYIIGEYPLATLETALPPTKVIDLSVVPGFGDVSLNLAELNIRNLEITNDSYVADVVISTPQQGNTVINLNSQIGPIRFIAPSEPIALNIQEFYAEAGAGALDITLPVANDYTIDVTSMSSSSVTLSLPSKLEARVLLGETAADSLSESSVNIGSDRLRNQGQGVWETEDYVDAREKVEIVILGGQGSIDIVDAVEE